uniref:Uncharacterized protein n=1 Tax=Arundo donax TaxID=35708 RepID=A0A0A8ZPR5_ARUDO
MAAGGSTVAAA